MKRKFKKVNIEELNAIEKLYNEGLTKKKIGRICLVPAGLVFVSSFLVFYNPILSIIGALIGGLFGYVYVLKKVISYNYEIASFAERNKFLTTLTQLLINKEKTIVNAIATAKSRTRGELKDDLTILERRLLQGERSGVHNFFEVLNKKYEKDIIFCQYLEQLETSITEGRVNLDTLQDITNYHNLVQEQQRSYTKAKDVRKGHFFTIIMLVMTLLVVIGFSMGLKEAFIPYYSRSLVGLFTGVPFLLLLYYNAYKFTNYYLDYSVTDI